jgi:hypothetical protein
MFRPEVALPPALQSHAIFANAFVDPMRLMLLLPIALVVAALG